MNEIMSLGIYILQMLLQLFAITICLWAWRHKNSNGTAKFWLWFGAGMSFQFIRRLFAVLWMYNIYFPADLKSITLLVIPTCVSICYAIAMYKVYRYIVNQSEKIDYLIKLREINERLG